jgi:hypothetical protein
MANTFLVAHSFGELENFFSMTINSAKKFNLVIYKKNIFDRLKKDTVFNNILKKKKIKVFFPNTFYKRIYLSIYFFIISKNIFISDSLPIIYSKFFHLLDVIFLKKSILISHSTTPLHGLSPKFLPRNFTRDKKKLFLVNNFPEYKIFKKIGYKTLSLIQNPYKNKYYISECKKVNFLRKNYILVYSSGYNKEIFNKNMRHHQYRVFFNAFRRIFKDRLIIIKPHPGESANDIKKILIKINQTKNVIVSEDNTLLLTINASGSISFLTGGIFCSKFNNIPAFNFYLWHSKYRYYLNKNKLGKCHIEKSNCRNAKNELDLYRELSLLKKKIFIAGK